MRRVNMAAMENTPDLIGRIVCLPGGVRVRVESIDEDPPRAFTRRVGGPHDGIPAICLVSKLEPTDPELEENTTDLSVEGALSQQSKL